MEAGVEGMPQYYGVLRRGAATGGSGGPAVKGFRVAPVGEQNPSRSGVMERGEPEWCGPTRPGNGEEHEEPGPLDWTGPVDCRDGMGLVV